MADVPAKVTDKDLVNLGIDVTDEEKPPIPWLNIKQPTTRGQDHVTNGYFYLNLTNESFKELNVSILMMKGGRELRNPDRTSKNWRLCASNDRIVPLPTIEVVQSDRCVTCHLYHKGATLDIPVFEGGKTKTESVSCKMNYTILGVILENYFPFAYTFRGSGYQAMYGVHQRLKHLAASQGKHIRKFAVKMWTDKGPEHLGNFYVPKLMVSSVSNDDGTVDGIYDSFKDYNVEKTLQEDGFSATNEYDAGAPTL